VVPKLSFEPTFEKSKHIFFGKFFHVILKNSYFEFGSKLKKTAFQKFEFVSSYFLQNFERILTFNLGGDKFSDEQSQKRWFIIQYVKKLFETNKGNFSGSKPLIGSRITFNPEEIGAFGLEQFFNILYNTYCISKKKYSIYRQKTLRQKKFEILIIQVMKHNLYNHLCYNLGLFRN
jgi:hypothetical protein